MVETSSPDQLELAEAALRNEILPEIDVEGEDAGAKLTHVLAARFVQNQVLEKGADISSALRTFFQRVRNSIA